MVISWLTSSLSPSIVESVQYCETAEDIWTQLNKRYSTVNGTKIFEIKKELASTNQGTLDIASYFNKLKKLWDELRLMRSSHSSTCTCTAKAGIQKDEEEDRLHQFLMGLNETYPSHPQKQYPERVSFDSNRATQFCKYCKKSGHLIDKCYKFHGLPTGFKFTKGRKMAANAEVELASNSVGSHVSTPASHSDGTSSVLGLTKEQYAQLISLLHQAHMTDPSSAQSSLMASANFADNLTLTACVEVQYSASLLSRVAEYSWILDFGATHHMTSHKNILSNIQSLVIPYLVTLSNGYKAHSLKRPLKVGKLEHGLYRLLMSPSESTTSVVTVSLPFVSNATLHYRYPLNVSDCSSVSLPPVLHYKNHSSINKEEVLWHQRLGHIPFVRLKDVSVFGCLCFHTIPKCHRDRFQPRAEPCVFLGYSLAKKGYKLFNLSTKQVLVFRDVIFHEHIFPVETSIFPSPSSPSSSFPVSIDPSDSPEDTFFVPISLPPSLVISSIPRNSSNTSSSPPLIPHTPSIQPTRKSSRPHHLPAYLDDFVCTLPPSLIGSSFLSSVVQLSSHNVAIEPQFYHQAISIPFWQEAMRKEF
ncbi:uncharacterized protein LOC142163978 [Nicotiana tabacum]|uniref:Uncharacterized protein LOC142163978 n=1 Tax=Nicotiana tabacum TaxID=4097 RepID=A0AC58RWX4_TOBAC